MNQRTWVEETTKYLEYPHGHKHDTFFKSFDKKHAFCMDDRGYVYEIIKTKNKNELFELKLLATPR